MTRKQIDDKITDCNYEETGPLHPDAAGRFDDIIYEARQSGF